MGLPSYTIHGTRNAQNSQAGENPHWLSVGGVTKTDSENKTEMMPVWCASSAGTSSSQFSGPNPVRAYTVATKEIDSLRSGPNPAQHGALSSSLH